MKEMYWLCEYWFIPHTDLRTSWERFIGVNISYVKSKVLIIAKTKDSAEEKFNAWYKIKHPNRVLKTWGISDTIY